jgi:hypothetical protein
MAQDWGNHYDVPSLPAQPMWKLLSKHSTPEATESPFSPDLAPCDFFPFPKLKENKTLKVYTIHLLGVFDRRN